MFRGKSQIILAFLNYSGPAEEVKEESLEDQIDYLLTYAKLNNDTDAAIKVIHLEALLLERDTKIALSEEKPSTSSLAHSEEIPVSCSSVSHKSFTAQEGPNSQSHPERSSLGPRSSSPFHIEGPDSASTSSLTHSEEVPVSAEDSVELEEGDFEQVVISGKSKKKVYQCEDCQYQTERRNDWKRHRRMHTGEEPFSCDHCDYKTAWKSDLKKHEFTHSGERPFSCSKCSYRAAHKRNLKRHEVTHTGIKPYSCSKCSYRTVNKSDLKRHELTHFGEKPFSCSKCSFRTVNKGDLKKHELSHSEEKPFSCSKCLYRCAYKSTLKSHEWMHSGDK